MDNDEVPPLAPVIAPASDAWPLLAPRWDHKPTWMPKPAAMANTQAKSSRSRSIE